MGYSTDTRAIRKNNTKFKFFVHIMNLLSSSFVLVITFEFSTASLPEATMIQRNFNPNFKCPKDPSIGRYPNPNNCSLFTYCVSGTPYPGSCPKNMNFNPKTLHCDNLPCHGAVVQPVTIKTTQKPSITGGGAVTTVINTNAASAKLPVSSSNPSPAITNLPPKAPISPITNPPKITEVLSNPELNIPGVSIKPGLPSALLSNASTELKPNQELNALNVPVTPIFTPTLPIDLQVIPGSLNVPPLTSDPLEILSNTSIIAIPELQSENSLIAETPNSIKPEESTPVIGSIMLESLPNKVIHKFDCKGKPCGIYPNINDCDTFILCSEGIEILKHCNGGLHFDTKTLECQIPEKATCWQEPTAGILRKIPKPDIQICPFHNKSPISKDDEVVSSSTTSLTRDVILSSPVVTNWGSWNPWKYCTNTTYVNGIQAWRRLIQAGTVVDQAGIVSISLNCETPQGTLNTKIESLTPGVPEDPWPPHITCTGGAAIGFRLNSEADQGPTGDDLATDNVELICSCGPAIHKLYEDQTGLQSGHRGIWTEEQICQPKQAICGMQTQMFPFSDDHARDNTGMNNMKVKCCTVPNPVLACKPTEEVVSIRHCENLEGFFQRRCDFERSVGLAYNFKSTSYIKEINFYESIGYSLNTLGTTVSQKFKQTLGTDPDTTYKWAEPNEFIFNSTIDYSVESIYIDVNSKTEIFQIVGDCSFYTIKTNWFMRVDTNITSGETKKTYYEI